MRTFCNDSLTIFRASGYKFKLYEGQGVKYYIIVDSKEKSTEIFEIINGNYQKIPETQEGKILFNLTDCQLDFDFNKIWK